MTKQPISAVRRLILERASQLMIETAKREYGYVDVGSVAACIAELPRCTREATQWVQDALETVRLAPCGAEYTNEAAAQEILDRVAARRGMK